MFHVGHKRKSVAKEGLGQEPISYTNVKIKSISTVISFPKTIFEIEHYECKSQIMHANEEGAFRVQTSFIFVSGGG